MTAILFEFSPLFVLQKFNATQSAGGKTAAPPAVAAGQPNTAVGNLQPQGDQPKPQATPQPAQPNDAGKQRKKREAPQSTSKPAVSLKAPMV